MVEFSLAEALKAQKAMRDELGLAEEVFEAPQFVGMVSDEIEQLRAKGWSDQKIAELITKATGQKLETAEIERHYIEPKYRQV